MNLMHKIFGAPATPAPVAAPPGPGQIPANPSVQVAASPGAAPNGVVPNNVDAPENKTPDPLDQFKDIWQPSKEQIDGPQPLLNVDPKALAEASKKTDFTKLITPEQLTAMAAGGEGAMQAFAQAINQVAQGTYAQSTFATTKIVEQAVAKAKEQWSAELPQHVKRQNVSETLRNENPALSHPAAAPILQAVEASITQKHPNASAAEISVLAKQYLDQFANAVQTPERLAAEQKTRQSATAGDTDWSTYLEN